MDEPAGEQRGGGDDAHRHLGRQRRRFELGADPAPAAVRATDPAPTNPVTTNPVTRPTEVAVAGRWWRRAHDVIFVASAGSDCAFVNRAADGQAGRVSASWRRPWRAAWRCARRLEVAAVEVADLDAVVEQHPVALPVEAVGQDDLALGARRDAVAARPWCCTRSPMLQVELVGVRLGQCVRLPVGMRRPVLPADRRRLHSPSSRIGPVADGAGRHRRPVKSTLEPVDLRGRPTRSSSSCRSPSTKPSSTATSTRRSARSPARSACPASVPARCRARCSRPASASAPHASRRCATPSRTTSPRPCASTTSTSSPRRRSRSPAATEDGPVAFDATCEVRPEITVPGYGGLRVELPSPVGHRRRDRRGGRTPSSRRHGSLVDVDRPVQSGDHVTLTCRPPATASRSPG